MKAILYARVSTAEQSKSGLGVAAQIDACRRYCEYRGLDVVDTIIENGVSGARAPHERTGMGRALAMLAGSEAELLVAAKLDRIGRDVRDLLDLVARADREGWGMALLDLDLDTSTSSGRLVLTVMAGVAEWERGVIAERTKAALAAAKAKGTRLGRRVSDAGRAAGRRAVELRAIGLSWRKVAAGLDAEGFARRQSTEPWTAAAAYRAARTIGLDAEAAAKHAGGSQP